MAGQRLLRSGQTSRRVDSGLLAGASAFVLRDLGFRAGIWFIASWGEQGMTPSPESLARLL